MGDFDYPISPRANYLRLIKNEDPQYLCDEQSYTNGFFLDAILQSSPPRIEGETTKDSWGVSWKLLKGHVGANPYITEETKVIKEVQKVLNGRMALQGGIDGAVFDFADWNEADVRKRKCAGPVMIMYRPVFSSPVFQMGFPLPQA